MKYFFLIVILLGCKNHSEKVIKPAIGKDTTLKTDTNHHIAIKCIDTVRFRISYFGEDTMPAVKQKELENSDPYLMQINSPKFYKQLVDAKVIHGDSLRLKSFGKLMVDFVKPQRILLKSADGDSVTVKIQYQQARAGVFMKIDNQIGSTDVKVANPLDRIGIKLLDLIPGGFNEIIILTNYYISNGDNYDICVYSINRQSR
jgi:hypothetical protein